MQRKTIKYSILSLLLCVCFFETSAQDQLSETELKKQADAYFEADQYTQAIESYSKLYSIYKQNLYYCYMLGASKLYGEKDKTAPLFFLEIALKNGCKDPDFYFYLAKAYHINYRFTEAITYYKKYETTGKKRKKLPVSREIEMCENGKNLLTNVTDIAVKNKTQISIEDFHKAYTHADFTGKVIKIPALFSSKKDKQLGYSSVMFTNPSYTKLFFSSYGETEEQGTDIYYVTKSENDEFSAPVKLSSVINTPYDEDFVFLHPNQTTLYFASKGHNSMGGFDIFSSEFNPENNTWSAPKNLDFAINSPGDDFLFITNTDQSEAMFASTRNSADKKIEVYTVALTRIPVTATILKGKYSSSLDKEVEIIVKNTSTGEEVGKFKPDPITGDYSVVVPNGGSFDFVLDSKKAASIHQGTVTIPYQEKLVSLNQNISFNMSANEETLSIENRFHEKSTVVDEEIKAALLKQKQNLEVNYDAVLALSKNPPKIEPEPEIATAKADPLLMNKAQNQIQVNNAELTEISLKKAQIDSTLNGVSNADVNLKSLSEILTLKKTNIQQENEALKLMLNSLEQGNLSIQDSLNTVLRANEGKSETTYNNLFSEELEALSTEISALEDQIEPLEAKKNTLNTLLIADKKNAQEAKKNQKVELEAKIARREQEIADIQTELNAVYAQKNNLNEKSNTFKNSQALAANILKAPTAAAMQTIITANQAANTQTVSSVTPADSAVISNTPSTLKDSTSAPINVKSATTTAAAYNEYFINYSDSIDQISNLSVEEKNIQKSNLISIQNQKIDAEILRINSLIATLPDGDLEKEQNLIRRKELENQKESNNTQLNLIPSTPKAVVSNQDTSKIAAPTSTPPANFSVNKANEQALKIVSSIDNRSQQIEEKNTTINESIEELNSLLANTKNKKQITLLTQEKDSLALSLEKNKGSLEALALSKESVYNITNADPKDYDALFQSNDIFAKLSTLKSEITSSEEKERALKEELAGAKKKEKPSFEAQLKDIQLEKAKKTTYYITLDSLSAIIATQETSKTMALLEQIASDSSLRIQPTQAPDSATMASLKADDRFVEFEQNKLEIANNIQKIRAIKSAKVTYTAKEQDSVNTLLSSLEASNQSLLQKNATILQSNPSDFSMQLLSYSFIDALPPTLIDSIPKQTFPKEGTPSAEVPVKGPILPLEVTLKTEAPKKAAPSDIAIVKGFKIIRAADQTSKEIPINPKMPDGIVYKVQVGAFRNPIPFNLFKEFTPIVGETTPSGLTRYLVGLFDAFVDANAAKKEIVALGYKDAFVVGYKDGVRVSISSLGEQLSAAIPAQNKTNEVPASTTNSTTPSINSPISKTNEAQTRASILNLPEGTKNIKSIDSVFFTVQVGAYKGIPKQSGMYLIQPLYADEKNDGWVRFTTGVFYTLEEAKVKKDEIINQYKINDAFVTAYANGQRISVAEALELIKTPIQKP